MKVITNKGFFISLIVTTLSLASTIIIADEEETVPEEETILGVPCQPFPECIVDALRITSHFGMHIPTRKFFENETIPHSHKDTEEK